MTEHTITPIIIMDYDYNEYQLRSMIDTDMELDTLLDEEWPVEELPQELLREF
jgi:hypothetical protein